MILYSRTPPPPLPSEPLMQNLSEAKGYYNSVIHSSDSEWATEMPRLPLDPDPESPLVHTSILPENPPLVSAQRSAISVVNGLRPTMARCLTIIWRRQGRNQYSLSLWSSTHRSMPCIHLAYVLYIIAHASFYTGSGCW